MRLVREALADVFWVCLEKHMQPSDGGGTYKVGVGCLDELLLGAVTDASVCRKSQSGF